MRFLTVRPEWPLVSCSDCAAVIVDDDEGANRAEHEAFHARVVAHVHLTSNGSRQTGGPQKQYL